MTDGLAFRIWFTCFSLLCVAFGMLQVRGKATAADYVERAIACWLAIGVGYLCIALGGGQ